MSSSPSKAFSPATPEQLNSLSRELESVIAAKNMLTARTRSKVLRDLGTAASETEDAVMQRLREKAVLELVQSEKSYLRHLEIVEEFFMKPIKEGRIGGSTSSNAFTHTDYVKVFGDLPAIIQVNKELLNSLENSTDKIGKVFLELAPYLKFYSTYAQDFESSAKTVERAMERSRSLSTFVKNQESRPEVQLRLNALLITPVQRIPRYKMLLEDVIKNTPDCHPDKKDLKEALETIDALAWHINDQLREHEDSLRMLDIQRSLVGNCPKILAPGRKLVRQGNLMKVPRAGGTAQSRYFILFTDAIMYCKIRISTGNQGSLVLPKTNSLECGLFLPLKTTSVETLVGKGVFKLTCGKEELILYSNDENARSEDWVDVIGKTIEKHRKDAATLKKEESTRREPIRRPEMLKMRRDSLSQIMFNASRHKVATAATGLLRSAAGKGGSNAASNRADPPPPATPSAAGPTPRKRRQQDPLPPTPDDLPAAAECSSSSPSKVAKTADSATAEMTPNTRSRQKRAAPMPPPPPEEEASKKGASAKKSSSSSLKSFGVTLRSKKIVRPPWKSLSLTMSSKERIRQEETRKAAVFRSPSIYDAERKGSAEKSKKKPSNSKAGGDTPAQNPVMASYLSGKMCPLTPSQQQTDVAHLAVQKELKEKMATSPAVLRGQEGEGNQESSNNAGTAVVQASSSFDYCAIM